ncbi:mitochondrial carrier homolog 1 isoform X2 [Antechinus flavipes]|uniref:mitochondrial carrier homolog 1 isoform X1 n=1 Tax=Antechinus flavipes TaxID=38775 RepID=UPI0022358CD7|nr:mitochondrial carrier homolog 1 isoform X1 [Antechinus flavipes]XP_051852775.1 mitochondrial carrier homolog 1 isoform X2 [Antechinus flavipes]
MGASDPEVAPWVRCDARGMVGAGPGAGGAEPGAPPGAGIWGLQPPRPPQSSSRGVEAAAVAALGTGDGSAATEALFLALGAGVTALSHPLFYVKLLIQVGHEPLPPTVGTNVLGRKVFYLPNFFTYARHIVQVDGKRGLFRGLSPRLMSSALSTLSRGSVKKAFPLEELEHVSNKDDVKTSLRKVVKETSHEMVVQCVSRVLSHPLHVISMRCMVQFVGREVKYSGVLSSIGKIFQEEGLLGFFVGLIPHLLGDVVFLWGCNLLAHFINAYLVDDSFSQALAVRSYTKFVMGIAVSMLTYPFLLVGDLMAVNNCGLLAGLPPYSPVFKSWIHCWRYLSMQGQLFRGSSLLFRRISAASSFSID